MTETVNISNFHGDQDFCLPNGELSVLFHENEANMTKATLREDHDI